VFHGVGSQGVPMLADVHGLFPALGISLHRRWELREGLDRFPFELQSLVVCALSLEHVLRDLTIYTPG